MKRRIALVARRPACGMRRLGGLIIRRSGRVNRKANRAAPHPARLMATPHGGGEAGPHRPGPAARVWRRQPGRTGHRGDGQDLRHGKKTAWGGTAVVDSVYTAWTQKGKCKGAGPWPTLRKQARFASACTFTRTAGDARHGLSGAIPGNCAWPTRGDTIAGRGHWRAGPLSERTPRPAPAPLTPGRTGPAAGCAAGPIRPFGAALRPLARTSLAACARPDVSPAWESTPGSNWRDGSAGGRAKVWLATGRKPGDAPAAAGRPGWHRVSFRLSAAISAGPTLPQSLQAVPEDQPTSSMRRGLLRAPSVPCPGGPRRYCGTHRPPSEVSEARFRAGRGSSGESPQRRRAHGQPQTPRIPNRTAESPSA